MVQNPKIIVVGGNAAGPSAAAKAKRVNPDAEVTLFEAGPFISTGTCELPYLISGVIKDYEDLIFFTPEKFYEEKKVKVFTKHFVESINRQKKEITVVNRSDNSKYSYPYDKLILTTGAVAKKLPDLPTDPLNLFTLKSVTDYIQISEYIKNNPVKNILIIGAGYIGLEAAENFKKIGYGVTILEKAKIPLPLGEKEVSHLIKTTLDQENIDFIGGYSSIKYNVKNGRINSVNIDGRIISADLIISSIGFKPNAQLALAAGLNIGKYGGIKTNNKLQTMDSSIFAAGDCIEVTNSVTGGEDYIPLATLAHEQGHIAGANAAGENNFSFPVVKNIAVKIFDNVYTSVGIGSEGARNNEIIFDSVSTVAPNLVKVMPNSKKTFGKILFENRSKRIIGGEFFGQDEVIGYADLISSLILQRQTIDILSRIHFNYTPPNSPFINILSILGRKGIK